MNRRAKRQKYRRLQKEFRDYVHMIEFRRMIQAQSEKVVHVETLTCAIRDNILERAAFNPDEYIAGYIARQFAKAIAERKDELVRKEQGRFGETMYSIRVVKND